MRPPAMLYLYMNKKSQYWWWTILLLALGIVLWMIWNYFEEEMNQLKKTN